MTECASTSLSKKEAKARWYWSQCRPHNCIDCGKERLVFFKRGKPQNERCKACAVRLDHSTGKRKCNLGKGPESPSWTGGRHPAGAYMKVWVDDKSPYFPMAEAHNYVLEHRLVMAQHLGRCLHKSEIVHHKNGNKRDNRIENLEITNPLQNFAYEKMCRNCELKKEIRLLRWELKQLTQQLQERMAL